MPVVVDPDSEVLDRLLAASPDGRRTPSTSPTACRPGSPTGPRSTSSSSARTSTCTHALSLADGMRLTRPSTSVVLVRDDVDTTVLRDAMHAGVRDVVPPATRTRSPPPSTGPTSSTSRCAAPAAPSTPGRIVTVFSPKGGVGKTTMAVNLALALADKGARKVCLVDLDLAFGDVAITLQLFPTHTIEHAIGSEDSIDAPMLESLLTRHADSLMVLAAPEPPRRPRAGRRRCWSRGSSRRCARSSTTSSSTPRRPSTSRR